MIEQQYYTRERGGLFSKTDGYDTIAKSPKLKLEFIKKYLHPLCSYDSPSELQKSGEEDETKYPPNLVIMPVASGELIIGQAVYKSKDFTGLRSTFFMHNYVLSANEKHRYVKEPEKLFGITQFQTAYDIGLGSELPTLAAIPYEGNSVLFKDRARLLSELKMDEILFEKLLAAIFTAASSKKKVFIVLDVPISELGTYAKALLYHVYLSLPWSVTEELGVSTYSRSSEAKKNIHITFLEKDALRYDGKVTKEFVLDFVSQKFLNLDETTHLDPYFKVAAMFRSIKPLWEKFNSYGEQLLNAMKDKGEKTLSFYNRTATLFVIYAYLSNHKPYVLEEGRERQGFLTEALSYLNLPIGDEFKRELIEVIGYAISSLEASLRGGVLLSREEIVAMLNFKLKVNQGSKTNFEDMLRILLEAIEVARRENNGAYIKEIFAKASKETALYQSLFEKLYSREELKEEVAYTYIKEAFEGINNLDAFITKVKEFEPIESILFTDVYYSNIVKTRFMDCLRAASNKVKLLEKVQQWCEKHQGRLYEELVVLAEEHFLKHIRLETIESEAALCHITFKHIYDDENYEAIKDYQKLKTSLEAMSPKHIKVNKAVQKQIQHFYKQTVKKEDFYMLVYAFLEPNKEAYSEEMWRLNLTKVLEYLYPISPAIMLDFIIWSKGQEIYMNKTSFDTTVIRFFTKLKEKEGKWPKELAKQKLEGQLKTKTLYVKLNKAMQPAIIKLLSQYGKTIAITCMILIGCAGVGIGGYFAYNYYLAPPPSIDTTAAELEQSIKLPVNELGLPEDQVKAQLKLLEENNKKQNETDETNKDKQGEADVKEEKTQPSVNDKEQVKTPAETETKSETPDTSQNDNKKQENTSSHTGN